MQIVVTISRVVAQLSHCILDEVCAAKLALGTSDTFTAMVLLRVMAPHKDTVRHKDILSKGTARHKVACNTSSHSRLS